MESGLGRLLHAAEALPADAVSLLVADELVAHDPAGLAEMDALASMRLRQSLVARWEYGWQPADLLHVVRRSRSRLVPLLATAIVAQVGRRGDDDAAARGVAGPAGRRGRRGRGAGRRSTPRTTWSRRSPAPAARWSRPGPTWSSCWSCSRPCRRWSSCCRRRRPGRASTVPSRPGEDGSERSRVLNRIRTLLAKAEATEFAAEAETFTAKAQDLMTRHAIDEALLRASGDVAIDIRGVRVHVHNPYAGEKVSLLNQVARANRCRAVWNKPLGLVTVLGTPVDVDQVEMLFTSLLIQATRAMAEAGARRAGSFDRSASFRRSFLMAYAVRIGERLTETSTAAAASYGAELVPVLQRQTDAVEAEFDRLFPQTRSARAGRYNAVGWVAGREAADRAHLTAGRLTT